LEYKVLGLQSTHRGVLRTGRYQNSPGGGKEAGDDDYMEIHDRILERTEMVHIFDDEFVV
jgi:hypothetical protein